MSTDCFPFLLLSDKSVDELNSRLEESESGVKVSDTWFRPNISVKDVSAPFVEDEWTYVKIGDGAVFRVNKLCGRCEYTNVDPETGTKIPRGEVLKVSAQTGFVPEVSFFACTKTGIKVCTRVSRGIGGCAKRPFFCHAPKIAQKNEKSPKGAECQF